MEFKNKKAIYLQIADYVLEQILLKKWPENEKIPSVRELAVTIEVNPNTVMRTYTYLQERDIIKMQRGIGYFVADGAYDSTIVLKKQEFIGDDLPQFFKTMELLGVDFDDLKKLYEVR